MDPVIPPTSGLNFLRTWWQRSDRTSAIAEARLLNRISEDSPTDADAKPLVGSLVKVPLNDDAATMEKKNVKEERFVNTLYLRSGDNNNNNESGAPFVLQQDSGMEVIENDRQSTQRNLVMCHGYGAGLGFFYRNYYALGQMAGWRIFALDWLGMGRSSRPTWTIFRKPNQSWDETIDEVETHFVESLEDWRKRVGLESMTLMGHSMGGYFVTCYALKYPQRVEKLILVSPAGIAERPPELGPQPAEEGATPQQVVSSEASELSAAMQANPASGEAAMKQEVPQSPTSSPPQPPARRIPNWARYLWERNVTPMSIVRLSGPFGASLVNRYTSRRFAHLSLGEQYDLYDYLYNITSSKGSGEYALATILAPGAYARRPLIHRLPELQMPTIFVYGENDWMDYKAAEKAKKHMQVPVKVIRIPDGGHHMYLDNPDDFNRVIVEELKDT